MKKIKVIFIIIICIIIFGTICTFATYSYFSKDIFYTKKDGTEISVEEALNELYNNNQKINYNTFSSGVVTTSSAGTFYTKSLEIPQGKKKIYIYSVVSSTWAAEKIIVNNSNIINNCTTENLSSKLINDKIDSRAWISTIETNGEEGTITIEYKVAGKGSHFVDAMVIFQ